MTLPVMMRAMKKLWKFQTIGLLELRCACMYIYVCVCLLCKCFYCITFLNIFFLNVFDFSLIDSVLWLAVHTIEETMRHLKFCGVLNPEAPHIYYHCLYRYYICKFCCFHSKIGIWFDLLSIVNFVH